MLSMQYNQYHWRPDQSIFFVICELPGQLEILFNDPDVLNCDVMKPTLAKLRPRGVLLDLYDGECFQNFANSVDPDDGFIHFSGCFSDDGTPLYKSSNYSIWPIFVSVLELPQLLRTSKLLLGGLWFGKGHANQELFLKPFAEHAKQISSRGFEIQINKEVKKMKFHIICCCADAPARASIQSIHMYNGQGGCNWCLHEGEILKNTVNTRIYPILENAPADRTQREVFEDGAAAVILRRRNKDAHVNGVIGVSPLHIIGNDLDIIKGMIVDFLHLGARGIPSQIAGAWFGDDGSDKEYYIGTPENLKRINFLIKKLSDPKELRRTLREIEDMPFYKARDWENWMLYHSLPIISNFHLVSLPGSAQDAEDACKPLPMKYIKHWALYVEAMHIILRTKVTFENLDRAHRLLIEFVARTEDLYGRKHMTYNMHILCHLCHNVKFWGQPWAICAYCFESMNGTLKDVIHANRGIPKQILRAISHVEAIRILKSTASTAHTKKFEEDLNRRLKNFIKIRDFTILGKTKTFTPSEPELYACNEASIKADLYFECNRVVYMHCLYKAAPSGNSCAVLSSGIRIYIRKVIASSQEEKCFFIASRIRSAPSAFMPSQSSSSTDGAAIQDVTLIEDDVQLFPISEVKCICVCIFFPELSKHFIIDVPNVFNVH